MGCPIGLHPTNPSNDQMFHPVFMPFFLNFGGISTSESPDKRWCWGVCYQDARRFRFGIGVSWHCAFHASDAIVYKAIPFETHCLSHGYPMMNEIPWLSHDHPLYLYPFELHWFRLEKSVPNVQWTSKTHPKSTVLLGQVLSAHGVKKPLKSLNESYALVGMNRVSSKLLKAEFFLTLVDFCTVFFGGVGGAGSWRGWVPFRQTIKLTKSDCQPHCCYALLFVPAINGDPNWPNWWLAITWGYETSQDAMESRKKLDIAFHYTDCLVGILDGLLQSPHRWVV